MLATAEIAAGQLAELIKQVQAGVAGRVLSARGVLFLVMAMTCAGRLAAQSASFEVLQSFSGPPNGLNPSAPVIQDSNGNFYGATEAGGNTGHGTVFEVTPAGVLTTLHTFTGGADGADPKAGLTQGSDGNFYGTTYGGGDSNGDGTVFKITPAGVLTTIYTFTGGTDGANPAGALIQGADGNFYGTTETGSPEDGTIFRITPAGVLTTIHPFAGNPDGASPQAGLIVGSDDNFYGTTFLGGVLPGGENAFGTVFVLTPPGVSSIGALTTLHTFTGAADGGGPAGLTQVSDGNFYGTTLFGGADPMGDGTVFKITSAGGFSILHSFSGGADGANPKAGVTRGADGNFYGTTSGGGDRVGEYGDGTVFRVTPAGVLTTIYTFSGSDGSHPSASLTLGADGNFYGTTFAGGDSDGDGTVFQITPAGVLTTIYAFGGDGNGAFPIAGLTLGSDGNFYGTTFHGGDGHGDGAVYQITPAGVLTALYAFPGGAGGANSKAGLTLGSDGNFYGTTDEGGDSYGHGTVFKIAPAGVLTTLHTFLGGADGENPAAKLTQGSDRNFYGTTEAGGAGSGYGTVFKITPAGVLTSLYFFSGGVDGAFPVADLTLGGDGNFYGTTEEGGDSNGDGTVFKITPDGVLTTLYTFTGGADGASPEAGLTPGNDGNFYGTTEEGGSGSGTVFQITPAGGLTTLYAFTGGADGAFPFAGLVRGNDGNFYGAASGGGDSNSDGTVFKITPAGVLTTLYTFTDGADGANPEAGLTLGADGSLYGTAVDGGQYTLGVVFRVIIAPPAVTGGTASAQVNSVFSFQIVATNRPTSFGASNLPPGLSINPATGLIAGTPTQSGTFTVGLFATNSVGTGSGILTLTVSPAPPVITSETVSAQVGSAFSFQIVATNNPISYAASNLPAGLSLDGAAGIISGTPTQSGTFSVGLSAANSAGMGAGTLTLTVNPTSPVITSASSASGQTGQPFTYQITASNTPASFGASGLPAGLSVDTGTGIISGTPTVSGTFSVALAAANAGGTGAAVLTITLAPALPAVTLAATVPQAILGSGDAGVFTLSLSAPQSADVVVSYTIKGTAINGVDYQLIKASKKIKAGKTSKVIKIVPQGDLEGASKKVVTLELTPEAAYTVGTTGKVKVKILAAP